MSESTRRGTLLLAAALLLGAIADSLLRTWPWGVNVPLWTAALLVTALAIMLRAGPPVTASLAGRLLLIPTLAFAAAVAWRDSPVLFGLNLLALLACLTLWALYSRAGQMAVASLTDYLLGAFMVCASVNVGTFVLLLGDIRWPEVFHAGRFGRAPAVARGLLLALPLVFLFGGLFAAADATFERLASSLIRFDPADIIIHSAVIAIVAWIVAGWGRQLLIAGPWDNPGSRFSAPLTMGMVELGVVLGSLDLLFLIFVVVQVGYLFGGAAFVQGSAELTYAEYARRGFFELVTVAAISLPLLLLLHWWAHPSSRQARLAFAAVAGAFLALLFVIMASAVARMALYTSLYGLTELRLYTTAFMGWLAAVFLWFAGTVLRGERQRFAIGALAAGIAAVLLLDVLNPDAMIARTNIGRISAPMPVDGQYLGSLSADAVPALVGGLATVPDDERDRLLATLRSRWAAPSTDWRTWNWSRAQASAAVDGSTCCVGPVAHDAHQ